VEVLRHRLGYTQEGEGGVQFLGTFIENGRWNHNDWGKGNYKAREIARNNAQEKVGVKKKRGLLLKQGCSYLFKDESRVSPRRGKKKGIANARPAQAWGCSGKISRLPPFRHKPRKGLPFSQKCEKGPRWGPKRRLLTSPSATEKGQHTTHKRKWTIIERQDSTPMRLLKEKI